MKKLVAIVFALLIYNLGFSQDRVYVFDQLNIQSLTEPVNGDYIKKNILGKDVSLRLALLREKYTLEQDGDLVDPGQKIIVNKPIIYFAVKRLNNYYKKLVKKNQIEKDDAAKEYVNLLESAIIIKGQNTEEFESELDDLKLPKDIIDLFNSRIKFE